MFEGIQKWWNQLDADIAEEDQVDSESDVASDSKKEGGILSQAVEANSEEVAGEVTRVIPSHEEQIHYDHTEDKGVTHILPPMPSAAVNTVHGEVLALPEKPVLAKPVAEKRYQLDGRAELANGSLTDNVKNVFGAGMALLISPVKREFAVSALRRDYAFNDPNGRTIDSLSHDGVVAGARHLNSLQPLEADVARAEAQLQKEGDLTSLQPDQKEELVASLQYAVDYMATVVSRIKDLEQEWYQAQLNDQPVSDEDKARLTMFRAAQRELKPLLIRCAEVHRALKAINTVEAKKERQLDRVAEISDALIERIDARHKKYDGTKAEQIKNRFMQSGVARTALLTVGGSTLRSLGPIGVAGSALLSLWTNTARSTSVAIDAATQRSLTELEQLLPVATDPAVPMQERLANHLKSLTPDTTEEQRELAKIIDVLGSMAALAKERGQQINGDLAEKEAASREKIESNPVLKKAFARYRSYSPGQKLAIGAGVAILGAAGGAVTGGAGGVAFATAVSMAKNIFTDAAETIKPLNGRAYHASREYEVMSAAVTDYFAQRPVDERTSLLQAQLLDRFTGAFEAQQAEVKVTGITKGLGSTALTTGLTLGIGYLSTEFGAELKAFAHNTYATVAEKVSQVTAGITAPKSTLVDVAKAEFEKLMGGMPLEPEGESKLREMAQHVQGEGSVVKEAATVATAATAAGKIAEVATAAHGADVAHSAQLHLASTDAGTKATLDGLNKVSTTDAHGRSALEVLADKMLAKRELSATDSTLARATLLKELSSTGHFNDDGSLKAGHAEQLMNEVGTRQVTAIVKQVDSLSPVEASKGVATYKQEVVDGSIHEKLVATPRPTAIIPTPSIGMQVRPLVPSAVHQAEQPALNTQVEPLTSQVHQAEVLVHPQPALEPITSTSHPDVESAPHLAIPPAPEFSTAVSSSESPDTHLSLEMLFQQPAYEQEASKFEGAWEKTAAFYAQYMVVAQPEAGDTFVKEMATLHNLVLMHTDGSADALMKLGEKFTSPDADILLKDTPFQELYSGNMVMVSALGSALKRIARSQEEGAWNVPKYD